MSGSRRPGPLVVVGDSLLDVDLEGRADRLAPDAPVPVVEVEREWQRPGGAGLAALLASHHHDDVVLLTAVGTDEAADRLRALLAGHVEVRALPLTGGTSKKTRVLANGVPVTRLDVGAGRAVEAPLPDWALDLLDEAGAILVADYGRGVAALPEIRERLVERARHIPVVWDPHPRGSAPVPGCTLVTPNAAEAQTFGEPGDAADQGRWLCRRWQAHAVAVTLGGRGALLTESDPVRVNEVPLPGGPEAAATDPHERAPHAGRLDTCGAGDAFAAAATAALLDGATALEAVQTAVAGATAFVRAGAASAVSTRVGLADEDRSTEDDAFALIERVRRAGGRVVATGGCFDLLHRGHVTLLTQARALGDALVVCLNSDDSVRRAKGDGRPLVTSDDRARVLSALECVDGVVVFDEPTPTELLARLRPDVWVKGSDYSHQEMPEAEVVRRAGGRIVLLPVVDGYSTTRLVGLSRRAGLPPTTHTHTLTQEVS